jgi:hypothetical protein
MPNKPQPFRQHQITRALRAAAAAGVANPTCTICLSDGTELVVGGAGGKPGDKAAAAIVKPTKAARKGR